MNDDEFSEKRSFLQRFGFLIGIFAVVGGVAAVFGSQILAQRHVPLTRAQQITMVRLLPAPPPAPPPPPPPPQRVIEDKMIEQTPIDDPEPKPDDKPAEAAAVGTSIVGNGPADGFGLGANRSGGFLAGGSGRHGGSTWGWYAGEVQTAIGDALRRNAHTRNANFRVEVRVWSDSVGRIVRARLGNSTGNLALDQTIRDDVLTGLQLQDAPPRGMPMPIVMRLTARRTE